MQVLLFVCFLWNREKSSENVAKKIIFINHFNKF